MELQTVKSFFRNIGFAAVFLIGSAVVNAATITGTYAFGDAKVEFLAQSCTSPEVVANLKFWDHAVVDYQKAFITYGENNQIKVVEACYTEFNGEVDIHWGEIEYVVIRLSDGTRL